MAIASRYLYILDSVMKIDIEEKVEYAQKLHAQGYTCAQSVVMAFCNEIRLDCKTAERMAFPFGSGVARMREICGCVSAIAMTGSFIIPYDGVNDKVNKQKIISWIREAAEEFRKENGDIVCKRLLGIEPGCAVKKKPCNEYVGCAVRIIGRKINEM